MAEKYIEKSIDTDSGVPAVAWDGTVFMADLESGKGRVSLLGYASEDALVTGKVALQPLDVDVDEVTALAAYEDVFTELATVLLGDPESLWYGGSIIPCPINIYGRLITKDVETPSGAVAHTWRCGRMRTYLKKNKVLLDMVGYKDTESFCEGKPPVTDKHPIVVTLTLDTITTYPALYGEILTDVLGGAVFSGGVVKEIGS